MNKLKRYVTYSINKMSINKMFHLLPVLHQTMQDLLIMYDYNLLHQSHPILQRRKEKKYFLRDLSVKLFGLTPERIAINCGKYVGYSRRWKCLKISSHANNLG